MTRKMRAYRILAVVTALAIAFTAYRVIVGSPVANAATQAQINTLKQQQQETEKKKQQLQKQINDLKAQQAVSMAKKQLLDQQMSLTEDEIDNITAQIDEYDKLITQKTDEIREAQATEDAHLAKYKTNMRTMEENGAISYISVIFQANSFSDLLSRINDVGEIMEYQQNLYTRLKEARRITTEAKSALESAKTGQEAARTSLSDREAELQGQIQVSLQLIQKLEADVNTATDLYNKEQDSANQIQTLINDKVAELKKQQEEEQKRQEEERKKQEEALKLQQQQQQQQQPQPSSSPSPSPSKPPSGSSVVGTGTYKWPVPSCYIVTSPFGMRFHPIQKRNIMHQGVDIGASYGSDVIAADSGTVILRDYDAGGYGYYMVVDHGNGATTLYAHLSKYLKSVGATVKKGDVIAKSGSSGGVTGPHLHFEISINGSRVDPLKYFSGYTKDY